MQKSHLLIVIGIGIIISGIILGVVTGTFLEQQFPSVAVLIAGDVLDPGEIQSVDTTIDTYREFYLGVNANPPNVPLIAKAINDEGKELVEVAFHGVLMHYLQDVPPGNYSFAILNVGERPVSIFVILSPENILDKFDSFFPISLLVLVGVVIIIVGVVVLIIGATLWGIQLKLNRKKRR